MITIPKKNLLNKKLFLLFLLFLSIISFSFSEECTEQWSELELENWTYTGDVSITNDDKGLQFTFEKEKPTTTNDMAAAVWNTYDFSQKKGLLISFRPTIKQQYGGTVRYPQGFAIVFTSSSIENLVGAEGKGIGYEGIINAVVFEFDFHKDTTYGDLNKPHFSVHYNINGAVSSSSSGYDKNLVNQPLPNFYDNSETGYIKNIIFEIKLIGNRIIVKSNNGDNIVDYTFTEFQQLLEQEDVHVGITSSMSEQKKIVISDFKISEISTKDKANLALKSSSSIKAGEDIVLLYSINSICNQKLKIYPEEYSSDNFVLKINNNVVKPKSISFNEETVDVEIKITENLADTYTAFVDFRNHISAPVQFTVIPNDVKRFELCHADEKNPNNITNELEQTKDYFTLYICAYDQYDNSKTIKYGDFEPRVQYPNNLLPERAQISKETEDSNKRLIVKIPFTSFGLYKIFNENFIDTKIRYLNLMPEYISPENSEISLLYENNVVNGIENTLKIIVKDKYGRNIPKGVLEQLECDFSDSKILEDDNLIVTPVYNNDFVFLKVKNISNKNKYTFVPKVKCKNIPLTELNCGYNPDTKLSNCEFYYQSTLTQKKKVKAYSDFENVYYTYESGKTDQNPLVISLDENENKKITEILLLDDNDSVYLQPSQTEVTAKLSGSDEENLTVVPLGHKYTVILPRGKTRDDYSPTISYHILLTIGSNTINIPVRFYFLNNYMNNVNTIDKTVSDHIAFFKQSSFKLKASGTLLLFNIFELSSSGYLGNGEKLDVSKVELLINSKKAQIEALKVSNFISITNHDLTQAGLYNLQLKYDSKLLIEVSIEITAKDEAYYFGNEEGIEITEPIIKVEAEQLLKLTLLDKFGNILKDNQVFNAFGKIKISNLEVFKIRPSFDGKIHIFNDAKNKISSILMTLDSGKEYTIKSNYTPTFENVDPLNSYGLLSGEPLSIEGHPKVNLYLRDKYGNTITSQINQTCINVFVSGKNLKEAIPLITKSESTGTNGIIEYSGNVGINGDFSISIFIDDIPVECKGCNFRNNIDSQEDPNKSILYLLGNKRRFPIYNNNNTALINKNDIYKNLIFYYEQRDQYSNIIKDSKSITFIFSSNDNKVDGAREISINSYGSNEDEKGFLKIDNIDKLKNLPDGLYQIEKSSGSQKYKIYLTSSMFESAEPDANNSMIVLNDFKIYGKVDIPGYFILDLRTKNYKRVQDINKRKVKINNDALKNSIITEGPEEGQLTVLLVANKPGKYDFTVSYDNKVVITQTYTYICGCGLDKKLKFKTHKALNDGNYAIFTITDDNGNECYNVNNLNELKLEEYRNNFIAAKNGDKVYKTSTLVNYMTNSLVLYLDRYASGSVTFSSNVINIDESEKTLSLTTVILDENHFYVKKDKTEQKLTIKPLDDNYEFISKTQLKSSDFDVTLINIVDDDFVVLKNDFKVFDGLVVDISEGEKLINGRGKFLYIVYYRGKELFCENCLSQSENNVISKIKVYHKEGNNYFERNNTLISPLSKANFPFFKINLMTNNDHLVVVNNGVVVTLKAGEKTIDTEIKYVSNGNIYVYLEEKGRNTFLSLNSMEKLQLKITYDTISYEIQYYIINHYVNEPSSLEKCAFGAVPVILNRKPLYFKRVDEVLELDLYLSDCSSDEKNIYKKLQILEKGENTGTDVEVIPTDIYGGYLLFLPKSLPVTNSKHYYIVNKQSKSSPFELSIMPGYDIKSAELRVDKKMTESTTDKLFTYFLVEFKDEGGNIITNVGRNMFANDFYGLSVGNNLPYLLSYDEEEQSFRGQVPITGTGTIDVSTSLTSSSSSVSLEIIGPQFLTNSLFTLEEEKDNEFTFSVVLKDEFYKTLSSKDFLDHVTFKYYTYNPASDELFTIEKVKAEIGENNKIKVTLNSSTPKYSIYGFIPLIKLIPQICTSCFKKQSFQNFIFSIGEKEYLPHNLGKDQFLVDKFDIPIYLFLSHQDITIDSQQMTTQKIISNKNTNLYLLSYKEGKSIKVDFSDGQNTKTLNIKLVDYTETTELEEYTGNENVEKYGFNVYNVNNLDNNGVSFFIDVRDNDGKLISTTPNLIIDNSHKEEIKKITVIKTSFIGIYFVKMSFYKSANIKYDLKFSANQENINTSIKLNVIAAFPNQITLINKERIDQRVIRYELLALNSNAEQICDKRLNLYIDDCILKSFSKKLVFIEDVCYLYVKFYGDAVIQSTLNKFSSEIYNNENSLYLINPHFSSLTVSPNVFSDTNSILTVSFNEKSPSLSAYNKNEIIGNKKIYTYQYFSPTKCKLVKTFSSLYSTEYDFSPEKFGIMEGDIYVLVGSILDTTIFPTFVHYQISKSSTISNIKAAYFSVSKKAYSLIEMGQNGEKTESFELNIPLLLIVNFLDSKGNILEMENKNITNLKASIVLNRNKVEKTIDLNIRQLNDIHFRITIDANLISVVKHLPSSFPEGKSFGYNIKICILDKEFLLPFYLKKNLYQAPSNLGFLYGLPLNENSFETFSVKAEDNSNEITVFRNTQNIHHICLFIDEKYDEENESVLPNKHLDYYQIQFDTDCDAQYTNSYMGCIDFSLNCEERKGITVKYNGKESSITMNFMNRPSSFSFDKDSSTKTYNLETSTFAYFFLNAEGSNPISKEYYKIYINGDKVNKKDLDIVNNNGLISISFSGIKYFNAIPRNKDIKIIFDDGINRQLITKEEYSISVVQKTYPPTLQASYSFQVQPPLDIFAGDTLYFYLNVKDSDNACYYEDLKNLSIIEATTKIDNLEVNANVTSREKLIDNSKCEYIYVVNFGKIVEKAGDLNIKTKDKYNTQNFKIYISAKEIVADKSSFDGDNQITAGQIAHISFTSKDEFYNNINYFDLFKKFDIKLIDKDKVDVEKNSRHYTYTIKVEPDNSKINIDIKINDYGLYYVKALINDKVLDISHKINVNYGDCSTFGADPKVLPIDNRDTYYSGETIVIQIDCKDGLGNIVTEEGKSIFIANIKEIESGLNYKYTKTFEKGHHLITFTPPIVGNYTVDITLNGKKYGNTLEIPIESIDYTKYNCMDKRLVSKIADCETTEYKKLLRDILGESYVCDSTNNEGKLFKCTEDSNNCVLHTNECGCLNGLEEWNGFCYRSDSNPISTLINNKITCLSKLKSKDHNTTAVICDDGSCRFNEKECKSKFECPMGFKVCGVKCILLNEICKESVSCSSEEVLCWDLSCAIGYDLCPTRISCPEGKVLCPDGSCQNSGYCIQPVKRTCEKNQYQCPDFSCVYSKSDCKKNIVCEPGFSLCEDGQCKETCDETEIPSNKYRCSNGVYVDSSQLCPSDMFIPEQYVKCPNGGVALNIESCTYVQKAISITCPKSKPILCPDFACVEKSSDCSPNIPTCPPHKPFKCWNNECRTSFDECPTPMECPKKFPILCQSGLCVKSIDECKVREKDTCPDYRCFDGTCVKSMELCPTHKYCGKGIKKCWNGACVADIENTNECRTPILEECSGEFTYRCPDGSCRKASYECSTISVCPAHLPIKCFDNSCRASINECPIYTPCGGSKKSCPDGTCASNFEDCNTIVTCYSDNKPFLCYDNSCKAHLDECPEPPKCTKNEVLCPNGACLSSRQNCKIFDPCEASNPIRCESNTCTNNYNDCNKQTKRCPIGYILCSNGDCKTSEYLCDEFKCPKNKPYFCREGVCVNDKSLCDVIENGCPYNKPHKCKDGTCVENNSKCNKNFECEEGLYRCDDGSCLENKEDCPNLNGCYKDRPFKCADGTCINPENTNCSIVLCPFNAPYKCANGYCVKQASDCPNELRENDLNECKNGLIMCIDGRCVPSSDYCRPSFQCESGYTLCPDGTCRVSEEICPKEVKCPNGKQFCKNTNKCVLDENDCNDMICPNGYTKCESNGQCVATKNDCDANPNKKTNGCPKGGVKCPNGRCLNSLSECSLSSNSCPNDDEPYLCSNGECISDISKCPETDNPGQCESGKERCSSGRCIEKSKGKSAFRTLCSNNIGCPLNKPFRCSNGECVENNRKCEVTTVVGDSLMSNMVCDVSKPYLCADKSCVSDPSFCKPHICPTGFNTCQNGYCVEKSNPENINCLLFAGFCPISNPIHCPSGTCVDHIAKCSTSFYIPKCSEGEFYCARLNQCLVKKLDCLIYYEIEKAENKESRNLLENFVDPLNDKDFIKIHKRPNKDIISLIEEDNDSDKDIIDGTICYDGTIAKGNEKCPPVPPCKMGEYRCENGGCASDIDKCYKDEEYVCKDGEKKCPDGMCHTNCNEVFYQGCEVGKYQCSNGLCVEDKYDCIGHSMCSDVEKPFRCMNGDCKSSPSECEIIERLGNVRNITYSFNRRNNIKFDFAFNENGRSIGSLEIPSQALLFSKNKNYSRLYISEVPSSILHRAELYNNTPEFLFNVSNSILDSQGILNFENSVMSPVFKIYYDKNIDNIKFNISGIINMAHNEYEESGFNYSDYCLGRLIGYDLDKDIIDGEEPKWECAERQTAEGQTEFTIREFGVYAIILNPLRQKINYFGTSVEKNFFLENVKYILIVLACIIIIVALVFYIFVRVTRYRQKYHENRAKILLLQQQKQEYENMTTDIFGQTLGDNINGIVYKANPAYTTTDEIKKSGTSLEDEIEKLQIECRNVNDQNERLQKDIADITDEYKVLSSSIENMNK